MRAFTASFDAVAAILASVLEPDAAASARSSSTTPSTSTWLYHTSRLGSAAIWRMASRYTRPSPTIASVRTLFEKPSCRAAMTMLAASRFTSHSHGPGRVSSKSLQSKTSWRSGEPKAPKLDRWASPQSCAERPERAVEERSEAITSAAPRKKVKGDTSIRPWRMGTSSGTLVRACSSSSEIGSGRSGAGSKTAWRSRGTLARAAFPLALLSASVRWVRAAGTFASANRVFSSTVIPPPPPSTATSVAPRTRLRTRRHTRALVGPSRPVGDGALDAAPASGMVAP